MKKTKKYFWQRICARISDYLFIFLITQLISITDLEIWNPLILYFIYNLVFAIIGSPSLGKWIFKFKIKKLDKNNNFSLLVREFLFIILFPIVTIHFIFCFNQALHEKISQTTLIKES